MKDRDIDREMFIDFMNDNEALESPSWVKSRCLHFLNAYDRLKRKLEKQIQEIKQGKRETIEP